MEIVQEVDFDPENRVEKSIDAINSISPRTPARRLRFTLWNYERGGMEEREYFQDELGMGAAERFFNEVLLEAKKFIKGEYGVSVGQLFGGAVQRGRMKLPEQVDSEALDKTLGENQQMIEAFITLCQKVPSLRLEITALSLGVPDYEVEWFKRAIGEPPHRGGLTIREAFDILRWFVRQNAAGLRRFFEEEATSLWDEIVEHVVGETTSSSSSSAAATSSDESDEPRSTTPSPGGRPSSTTPQPIPSA